jgi:hypothetical protein
MSNEIARIRRIRFATAVFRSIVRGNANGITRKDRRKKGPDLHPGAEASIYVSRRAGVLKLSITRTDCRVSCCGGDAEF